MKNFTSQKSNPTGTSAFWDSSSTKRFTVEEIRRSTLFHTSKNMESNVGGILLDWNATELRGLNGTGRKNIVRGIRFKHFQYFAERVIWYLLTNSAVSPMPVDICHGSSIVSFSEDSSLLRCYILSSGNSYGRFGGASYHNLQGQAAQEAVPAQEYWVITSLRDVGGRKDDKIPLWNVSNRLPGVTAWRPKNSNLRRRLFVNLKSHKRNFFGEDAWQLPYRFAPALSFEFRLWTKIFNILRNAFVLCFVDRASRYILVMKTNLFQYLSSVYSINQPLHVSGIFVAHHQKANRQSTKKHNTYQLLYIFSIPPDDGLEICPNM
jgi:hypothetical protein